MATDAYDDILNRAKEQLSREEQKLLSEELSRLADDKNGPPAAAAVTDPREQRKGPATTELGRKLRDLRKQHIAAGGQLLNMDEIDELVAECQGSLTHEE